MRPPPVQSFLTTGARRGREIGTAYEHHPARDATNGSPLDNLRFALRHEPLDLRIIHGASRALGPRELEAWVHREPTGARSRRAWFLYERLTGKTLDVEVSGAGSDVDALDPRHHFTAAPVNSPRHRVRDNLLGGHDLCVTIRCTEKLMGDSKMGLPREIERLVERYAPDLLARAVRVSLRKRRVPRSPSRVKPQVPAERALP